MSDETRTLLLSRSLSLCVHQTNVIVVTQRAGEFTPALNASNPPRAEGGGDPKEGA